MDPVLVQTTPHQPPIDQTPKGWRIRQPVKVIAEGHAREGSAGIIDKFYTDTSIVAVDFDGSVENIHVVDLAANGQI